MKMILKIDGVVVYAYITDEPKKAIEPIHKLISDISINSIEEICIECDTSITESEGCGVMVVL